MSFLSEYDFEIQHIEGKENKVVGALSHHANLLFPRSSYECDLENHILSVENYDRECRILKENTAKNEQNQVKIDFILNKQGLLVHKNRLCIPNIAEIKLTVMTELHKQPYPEHVGYQNMVSMIRKYFFWPNMKKEVAENLYRFLECQQVKA